MTNTTDPLVGRVLNGRYKILSKLARGGMATVYRAHDNRLSRIVAIKIMRDDLSEDPEFVAKFHREAHTAATLCHPNVVAIFDQGETDGHHYIVMELVEGTTLRHIIASEAPLHPEKAIQIIDPIVSALAAAHEIGLIHRDIKPENVLISDRGQVKVVDFGLARLLDAAPMTAPGIIIGTASYLAPELVASHHSDTRNDVYSMGVMMFEMLTGKKPHTGANNYQIAHAHVNVDIPSPRQALKDYGISTKWHIPDYLDTFVNICTSRNPDRRPKDALVMYDMLRRIKSSVAEKRRNYPELAREFKQTVGLLHTEGRNEADIDTEPQKNTAVIHTWLPRDEFNENTEVTRVPKPPSAAGRPRTYSAPRRTPAITKYAFTKNAKLHQHRGLVAILTLLAICLVVASCTWWWFAIGRYTTTPDLLNQSPKTAKQIARSNGFTISFEQEYSETVPKGSIIRTQPSPNDKILREANIHAWVSNGPERYPMPTITGLNLKDATKTLKDNNLDVGTVTKAYSEKVPLDQVISGSAAPGEQLKKGTKIGIVISLGPKPIDITDFTKQDARTIANNLAKAGIVVEQKQQNDNSIPAGKIISQDPKTGQLKRGDKVTLVVSKGPELVVIPNFPPLSQLYTVRTELEKLGLQVEVAQNSNSVLQFGLVTGTNPKQGTSVPKGSKVIINVS